MAMHWVPVLPPMSLRKGNRMSYSLLNEFQVKGHGIQVRFEISYIGPTHYSAHKDSKYYWAKPKNRQDHWKMHLIDINGKTIRRLGTHPSEIGAKQYCVKYATKLIKKATV